MDAKAIAPSVTPQRSRCKRAADMLYVARSTRLTVDRPHNVFSPCVTGGRQALFEDMHDFATHLRAAGAGAGS